MTLESRTTPRRSRRPATLIGLFVAALMAPIALTQGTASAAPLPACVEQTKRARGLIVTWTNKCGVPKTIRVTLGSRIPGVGDRSKCVYLFGRRNLGRIQTDSASQFLNLTTYVKRVSLC